MRTLVGALALLAVCTVASGDEAMRCGSSLVTTPISLEKLLQTCGEPAAKEVSTEDIRTIGKPGAPSRAIGTTTTEKWTYRPDAHSLPMVVTIIDGKVTKIERGK